MLKTKITSLALVGLIMMAGTGLTVYATENGQSELTLRELVQDKTVEPSSIQIEGKRANKLSGFTGNATVNGNFKDLSAEEREEIKAMLADARQVIKSEKKIEIADAMTELQAKKETMLDEKISDFKSAKNESETLRETLPEEKKAELEANKAELEANKEAMLDGKKDELEAKKAEKQAILNENKSELEANKAELEAKKEAMLDGKKDELEAKKAEKEVSKPGNN